MTSVRSHTQPLLQRCLAYHFDGASELPVQFGLELELPSSHAPCHVVQDLRGLGVSEETIHILNLVPIVHVVWADTPPRSEQVQDVLNNAPTVGIRPGMVAWKLLELWLNARPDPSLFRIWNDYVGALRWAMPESSFEDLRQLSQKRAESAAQSMSSGFGLLPKTGPHDFAARQISAAFDV